MCYSLRVRRSNLPLFQPGTFAFLVFGGLFDGYVPRRNGTFFVCVWDGGGDVTSAKYHVAKRGGVQAVSRTVRCLPSAGYRLNISASEVARQDKFITSFSSDVFTSKVQVGVRENRVDFFLISP